MSKHTSPRRNLTQSEDAFEAQDATAAAAGKSWSAWARGVLEMAQAVESTARDIGKRGGK